MNLRKIRSTAIIAVILISALLPQSVVAYNAPPPPIAITAPAPGTLSIISTSATAQFPSAIQFNVSAQSDLNIVDARLHYRLNRNAFVQITNEAIVSVTPAKTLNTSYVFDLRYVGGLPSGVKIEYWWTVRDSGNNVQQSQIKTFTFEDTRYQWQTLKQGLVTLYWYQGNTQFAQTLMTAAQQALTKLATDTGSQLKEAVSLYIYANSQDLQGSMVFPQEWTGGVAFTEFNIIAIGISQDNLAWGTSAVVHELAHLVTNQMTKNPYNGIPVWLNEGLSMYAEGPLDSVYVAYFEMFKSQNKLISVRSLNSPFSADANVAYLAYAESYYLVKFLIDRYGRDKLASLLDTFAQGSAYDDALMKVYGFNITGLNQVWLASLN